MLKVPTNMEAEVAIPFDVQNGTEARAVLPMWIDNAQMFLMAGYGWQTGTHAVPGGTTPIILRPWMESLVIAVKGVCTDPDGTATFVLEDTSDANFGDILSLNTVQLTAEDLGIGPAPTTTTGWAAVPWYGTGALGAVTPSGTTKGSLQVVPVNAFRYASLTVESLHCEIYEMHVRQYVSGVLLA